MAGNPAGAGQDHPWPADITPENIAAVENKLRVLGTSRGKGASRERQVRQEPPPRLLSPKERRVFDIAFSHGHAAPILGEEECDDEAFANKTGDALVEHIRTTPFDCTNRLFAKADSRFAAFRRQNMIDVAEAAMPLAVDYDGTNSGNIQELFLFLRAGFYVEFYEGDDLDWSEPDDDIAAAAVDALDASRTTPTSTTRQKRIWTMRCRTRQFSWTTRSSRPAIFRRRSRG